MPTNVTDRSLSWNRMTEANPTHKGLVVTNAVLLATEVYSSELIQDQKCTARKAPEIRANATSRRLRLDSSERERSSPMGRSRSDAIPSLAAAMVREGTSADWARRIKIEAVETTSTPAASTA